MQEKTSDRYLLHLAAWLDAMEEPGLDEAPDLGTPAAPLISVSGVGPDATDDTRPTAQGRAPDLGTPAAPRLERITRKTVLEHPLLAPRLAEIYDKARAQNPTLPAKFESFINGTLHGERGPRRGSPL